MEIKIKHIILSVVLCLLSQFVFAQNPPPPDGNDGPCGQEDGSGNPPPPPGMCMPINNYVYPLLVLGVLLGAYNIQKMEAKD